MPVTAVTENQVVDAAGQLANVYEVSYTLPNRPGIFTLEVPRAGDAVAEAQRLIAALEAEVNAIYGL